MSKNSLVCFLILQLFILTFVLEDKWLLLVGGISAISIILILLAKMDWGVYLLPLALASPVAIFPKSGVHLANLVLVGLAISFVLGLLSYRYHVSVFPRNFRIVLLLISSLIFSAFEAEYLTPILEHLARYLLAFGFVFVIVQYEITTVRRLNLLLDWIRLAGLVAAIYGILIYYSLSGSVLPGSGPRIFGAVGGFYGAFLGLATLVYFHDLLNRTKTNKLYSVIAILILVLGLLLSQTRAWVTGTILGCLLLVLLKFRQSPSKRMFFVAVVTVLLTLIASGLMSRLIVKPLVWVMYRSENRVLARNTEQLIQLRDASLYQRKETWALAWDSFLKYPLTGLGAGNFRVRNSPRPALIEPRPNAGYADNQFINILAETGFIGGMVWLVLIVITIRALIRLIKNSSEVGMKRVSYTLFSFLALLLTGGMFWNLTSGIIDTSILALILAMLFSAEKLCLESKE